MWHSSFFSISFCFLFFLLPHENNSSSVNAVSVDLVNTTCKQCASKSAIFNYDFCVTSLQAVSISHVTNLQGLAIIAMELALGNATSTISTIEKMMTSGTFDPFAMDCLRDCVDLYADAASMLVSSIAAFLQEYFDAANVLMSAVMEATSTCEDGFTEKEGEVTPLTTENYNLSELSGISLCIINLVVSSELSSMSS
ncbi:unnamed protein product [Ilex paraguariensis]|uniref:Pectinesterase inhibitor domain-containing protein n=1 Tax=Ilex paraguariensis TaxID=185542 RepID=A0ABC8U0V1_9AQUA